VWLGTIAVVTGPYLKNMNIQNVSGRLSIQNEPFRLSLRVGRWRFQKSSEAYNARNGMTALARMAVLPKATPCRPAIPAN